MYIYMEICVEHTSMKNERKEYSERQNREEKEGCMMSNSLV